MSVAKITIGNEMYLTFVEHIKLFSALHPNYCVSLMEDQRKSSEGFLLVFTCNFNEWLLKLLGSKKDAKKYHKSMIKAHHGTCALFQVFEQETESEVITDKNISASIVLLETSSQGLWSNPSLSHLFSMNRLIQLTHRLKDWFRIDAVLTVSGPLDDHLWEMTFTLLCAILCLQKTWNTSATNDFDTQLIERLLERLIN